jgi:hypothetical protein
MEIVGGFYCRNCADVELAKRGVDPAHPKGEFSGSEVYVPPTNDQDGKWPHLGKNEPAAAGEVGRTLNLFA